MNFHREKLGVHLPRGLEPGFPETSSAAERRTCRPHTCRPAAWRVGKATRGGEPAGGQERGRPRAAQGGRGAPPSARPMPGAQAAEEVSGRRVHSPPGACVGKGRSPAHNATPPRAAPIQPHSAPVAKLSARKLGAGKLLLPGMQNNSSCFVSVRFAPIRERFLYLNVEVCFFLLIIYCSILQSYYLFQCTYHYTSDIINKVITNKVGEVKGPLRSTGTV